MGMSLSQKIVYGIHIGSSEEGYPNFMCDKRGNRLEDSDGCCADMYDCIPAWMEEDECKVEVGSSNYYDCKEYFLVIKEIGGYSHDGEPLDVTPVIERYKPEWDNIIKEAAIKLRVDEKDIKPRWMATSSYF